MPGWYTMLLYMLYVCVKHFAQWFYILKIEYWVYRNGLQAVSIKMNINHLNQNFHNSKVWYSKYLYVYNVEFTLVSGLSKQEKIE